MSVIPKCPHCGSTEQPQATEQDHRATTVLVLYCSSCGSILEASAASGWSFPVRDACRQQVP